MFLAIVIGRMHLHMEVYETNSWILEIMTKMQPKEIANIFQSYVSPSIVCLEDLITINYQEFFKLGVETMKKIGLFMSNESNTNQPSQISS